MTTATYAHAAFKIGDGKDIDLSGTTIRNGSLSSSYWHATFAKKIVVAGTWDYYTTNQDDYDTDLTGEVNINNNVMRSDANNDEVNFGSLTLLRGTYKVVLSGFKTSNGGIAEILHGATSLGTIDLYDNPGGINALGEFVYTITALTSGNITVKISGKNVASSGYRVSISRLEIIRTG